MFTLFDRFMKIESFDTKNRKIKDSAKDTAFFRKKKEPENGLFKPFSGWRRTRDSNSRAAFATYSLSRGASSPLE